MFVARKGLYFSEQELYWNLTHRDHYKLKELIMLQYRVTYENEQGEMFIGTVVTETTAKAVELVRNSISDYGYTVSVEAQPLNTVVHMRATVL